GRTTKLTDPLGVVTYTVYKDADHEVRTYVGWHYDDGVDGYLSTLPVQVSRDDPANMVSETLTYTWNGEEGLPVDGNDAPTGEESYTDEDSQIQSLTRSVTSYDTGTSATTYRWASTSDFASYDSVYTFGSYTYSGTYQNEVGQMVLSYTATDTGT